MLLFSCFNFFCQFILSDCCPSSLCRSTLFWLFFYVWISDNALSTTKAKQYTWCWCSSAYDWQVCQICILFISFSKASYSVYVNELMFIVTKIIVCLNTVIFGDWFSYYQYHVDDFTAVLILYARYELHPESLLCTYIIVILMHRFGSQGSLSAEVNCLMWCFYQILFSIFFCVF